MDKATGEVLGRVAGEIEGESVVVSIRARIAEVSAMPLSRAWLRPFPPPTLGNLVGGGPATGVVLTPTFRTSVLSQLALEFCINLIISFILSLEQKQNLH